ncbi:MAG: MbnP family copper-binding protein [Thiotrichales bacterium]
MPSHSILTVSVLSVFSAFVLTACNDSGDSDSRPARSATLDFRAAVGSEAAECGKTYSGVGSGVRDQLKLTDFRVYLSDVELRKADGSKVPVTLDQDGKWQYQNVALLDFENGCGSGTPDTNTSVKGAVAAGDYTGVCFKIGVPFALNHLNDATAPSPLNASGMLWAWSSGRKFIRVDGRGDPDGLNAGWNLHLGSTGCVAANAQTAPSLECANSNLPQVCVDLALPETVQNGATVIRGAKKIVFDIKDVLAGTDVSVNTPNTSPGCMSALNDPECIEIMPRLGLNFPYKDGTGVQQLYPAQTQALVRVE